ncbi:MAG: DegQ family serine endoprotease [Mariprofundaceae bacterium]
MNFRIVAVALIGFILSTSQVYAGLPNFADLTAKQKHAVVNISTTQVTRNHHPSMPRQGPFGSSPFDQFFQEFFQNRPQQERHSLGSGFIISADGFVVTNNHVVDNADEVVVKTSDGAEFEARVIGKDPKLDLALLKIDGDKFSTVAFGDSDDLRVGDWVLAIGNPFGLEQTVTAGIVSAKGRVIGAGPYDDFIQTDASINPGNSGGPLFNIKGEVVGINTAIFSRSGGNIGIGFAIPINVAKSVISELRTTGHVKRARLGVYIAPIDRETQRALGLENKNGALVRQVEKESAADKAGIQAGDVIVSIDKAPIKRVHDLPIRVARHAPGDKVRIEMIRNGKRKTVVVKVEEMPGEAEEVAASVQPPPRLGLGLAELTGDLARKLGTGTKYGVLVQDVRRGSPAARSGIQRGDVIYQINRKRVRSLKDFKKVADKIEGGAVLQIMIDRHGDQVFTILRIPKTKG